VLFTSNAWNLVPDDLKDTGDVFIRDVQTGTTMLISGSPGAPTTDYHDSWGPSMTPDARYVAFVSTNDNLVESDADNREDVFVRDRLTGDTVLVSVFPPGLEPPEAYRILKTSIDATGRLVTFDTWVYGDYERPEHAGPAFVHDRQTGVTKLIGMSSSGVLPNAGAEDVILSADGRFVLFASEATNLVSTPISGKTLFLQELGSSGAGAVAVSPSTLAFGNLTVGTTSAAKTVTVTNTGTATLAIDSISLGGTNAGQFNRTNNCAATLAAGAKCTVTVRFKPTSKGAKSATLRVTPSGGLPVKTVTLSGTGT